MDATYMMYVFGICAIYALIFVLIFHLNDSSLVARIAPKYAAKRRLKLDSKNAMSVNKYLQRKERKQQKIRRWAENHPDDDTAKLYLEVTAQGSSSLVSPVSAQDKLRSNQQMHDEMEQSQQAREREDMVLLEWAINHPDITEGYRHLMECIPKIEDNLRYEDTMIRSAEVLMQSRDEAETILASSELAERIGRRDQYRKKLERIQSSLARVTEPSE